MAVLLSLAVSVVALLCVSPADAVGTAHLRGTVTAPGGTPVQGAQVDAYRLDEGAGAWTYVASYDTTATGTYDFSGLEAGTYQLGFYPSSNVLAGEWWNDKPNQWTADSILVAEGADVSGKDVQLDPGSHITGVVTVAGSGAGLPGVLVDALVYNPIWDDWQLMARVTSQSGGNYDLTPLPAGNYKIQFTPPFGYVGEYFDDKPDIAMADSVSVSKSATVTGKNASIAPASHITGTVTSDGQPAPGVVVQPYLKQGLSWVDKFPAITDASGNFDITNLIPGTYRLRFGSQEGAYVNEYWNDKATLDAATDIVVGTSTTVSGKDAVLAPAAHITGTVTGPDGQPLIDFGVDVYQYDTAQSAWVQMAYGGLTAQDGEYDVSGLAAGTYRLGFREYEPLVPEYWNDKPTVDQANDIVVTTGETKTGIDAQLAGPTAVQNVTLPSVSGTPQVGSTLTAATGTWNPSDVTTSLQWLANGTTITGATGGTYQPVTGDVGKTISVRVTASKTGFTPATATSAPTAVVTSAPGAPPLPPSPPSNEFTAPNGGKANTKTGTLTLSVTLPGAGMLQFGPAGISPVKTVSKSVSAAGATTLTLKLTKAGQKKLKQELQEAIRQGKTIGKLKVKAMFTFTPTGGTPNNETHKYTVKLE